MKIEKLTENKIRIILNMDDLAEKNIDIHSLIKNTDSTQKLFRKMLKQAQKEVGFDIEDSRLLIEAFISSEGFFVVTFTKLKNAVHTSASDSTHTRSETTSHTHSIKPKVKRKSVNILSHIAIYEFNSFEEFCNFCTYLNSTKLGNLKELAKQISLYEYESKYFLVFCGMNPNFKNISLFYLSISEFARLVSNSPAFSSRLIEYGKIIFKSNAIQNGIKFFTVTNSKDS